MKKKSSKRVKKRYFLLFGFWLAIIWGVYKYILLTSFVYIKEVEITNGIDVTIETKFAKGCYDIGFYANDDRFNSSAYLPYKVEGKYEFEFYHDDMLLNKKIIEPKTELGHTYSNGGWIGASSSIILYVIEVPLKKHSELKIKLKSIALENRLKDKDSVYFYIDKHKGLCGEKRRIWLNKRNNPIKKAETNETLKPLYKALVTKNTSKVKEFVEKNNISIDVEMIGKRNPIHYSAFYNDVKTLDYLISNAAKLNEKDLTGKTPLHYAIEHNSTRALESLLNAGADFDLLESVEDTYFHTPRSSGFGPSREMKPSIFLIECNMVEMMEILLRKRYLDIDTIDSHSPYQDYNGIEPYISWLLGEQKYYEDPVKRKRRNAVNYSKMIKLLRNYGAKTYQELEENNITKGNKDGK